MQVKRVEEQFREEPEGVRLSFEDILAGQEGHEESDRTCHAR